MLGACVGWRDDIASGVRLTLAASYTDHTAVKGYNAVQDGAIAPIANGLRQQHDDVRGGSPPDGWRDRNVRVGLLTSLRPQQSSRVLECRRLSARSWVVHA